MTFTLTVPSTYGFVVLTGGVGPFVTNLVLSGAVMAARSKYKVFYPNLYAVPGVHEKADEFNRVQRSHQNMMELNDSIIVMTLLGGLKHPIACSIGSVLYCIGLVLYQRGYVDNSLDVKTARYQKGGILKWVGVGTVVVSTCSLAFSMLSA